MLIEFTVANYRSFHQPVTLSMLATPLRDDPELDARNIFSVDGLRLLRSAAIYGANASGKSNLVRAIMFMRGFVLNSATKVQAGEKIPAERFRLDVSNKEKPAYFQIVFFLDGKRYRYGFEVDDDHVRSEWLYHTSKREALLFVREEQNFEVSTLLKRDAPAKVQEKTRPNALFLSVLAQFNSKMAMSLLDWFRKHLRGISGLNDQHYAPYTIQRLEEESSFREHVREVIRLADTGILDIAPKTSPIDQSHLSEAVRNMIKNMAAKEGKSQDEIAIKSAEMQHPLFDGEKQVGIEIFDLDDESEGTQKFFALLGPLFDVLEHGWVLVVDELEARLHPLLTREIVRLFNTPESNPHNAQLVFATHDAALLGECLLRRDQVWFMQKDRYGATELYSLAEMKERKDASYLKNYLAGRYGGIPIASGFRRYIEGVLENATQAPK